jgi:predicted nucleic acid-binding protein
MKLLLDANILYPATLRQLFRALQKQGIVELYWSYKIIDEWRGSIINTLNPTQKNSLLEEISSIKQVEKDFFIEGYESMIESINNRDPKDRHVIAAAITAQVDHIITFNTRDFPNSLLKKNNIRAKHPDKFFLDLLLKDKFFLEQSIETILALPLYAGKQKSDIVSQLKSRGLIKSGRMLESLMS